jgi:tetratricopeptide (TPR) repeat protein
MTCTDVEQRELAERYVSGSLDEAEREAFEQHYFECARCYTEVEALRAVREVLARQPRRSGFLRRPAWLAAAAALVLVTSSAIIWYAQRSSDPAAPPAPPVETARGTIPPRGEEIARLAAVTPPPYVPRRFRGAERADFEAGMRRYAAGDFRDAIPLLERAVGQEPATEDARFYLGASYLLDGRAQEAVTTLEPLGTTAESSYAEEAQFLIAKAHLHAGNLAAAGEALERTVAMRGEREQEARELHLQVAAIEGGR